MLIVDYSLDMFRASLCPSSGEKTTCYCIWGIFAAKREDADISRVVFFGVLVCGLVSGYQTTHQHTKKDNTAYIRVFSCCSKYTPYAVTRGLFS